jgi:hypothetical protein
MTVYRRIPDGSGHVVLGVIWANDLPQQVGLQVADGIRVEIGADEVFQQHAARIRLEARFGHPPENLSGGVCASRQADRGWYVGGTSKDVSQA